MTVNIVRRLQDPEEPPHFISPLTNENSFQTIYNEVTQSITSGTTVLDLGCGAGMLGGEIAENTNSQVDLLDIETQRAKERTSNLDNAAVHQKDAIEFLEEGRNYDIIVASNVFQGFQDENLDRAIDGIEGALNEDGAVYFTSPYIVPAFREIEEMADNDLSLVEEVEHGYRVEGDVEVSGEVITFEQHHRESPEYVRMFENRGITVSKIDELPPDPSTVPDLVENLSEYEGNVPDEESIQPEYSFYKAEEVSK